MTSGQAFREYLAQPTAGRWEAFIRACFNEMLLAGAAIVWDKAATVTGEPA